MKRFRKEVLDFYKKHRVFQLSENIWIDLLGHAGIGLAVGGIIVLIRGIDVMPALLLCVVATTLFGLGNRIANHAEGSM